MFPFVTSYVNTFHAPERGTLNLSPQNGKNVHVIADGGGKKWERMNRFGPSSLFYVRKYIKTSIWNKWKREKVKGKGKKKKKAFLKQ